MYEYRIRPDNSIATRSTPGSLGPPKEGLRVVLSIDAHKPGDFTHDGSKFVAISRQKKQAVAQKAAAAEGASVAARLQKVERLNTLFSQMDGPVAEAFALLADLAGVDLAED